MKCLVFPCKLVHITIGKSRNFKNPLILQRGAQYVSKKLRRSPFIEMPEISLSVTINTVEYLKISKDSYFLPKLKPKAFEIPLKS